MSDFSDNTYENGDEQDGGDNLAELRDAAKRGNAAKAEADAARRELAFLKAGVDTDSPKGLMFMRGYDGDIDPAAIKAQFDEVFGGTTAPTPEAQAPTGVNDTAAMSEALREQTRERTELSGAGSDHTPPPEIDPRLGAKERFFEDLAAGKSREAAAKDVLSATIASANAGFDGAIVKPWTAEELGR